MLILATCFNKFINLNFNVINDLVICFKLVISFYLVFTPFIIYFELIPNLDFVITTISIILFKILYEFVIIFNFIFRIKFDTSYFNINLFRVMFIYFLAFSFFIEFTIANILLILEILNYLSFFIRAFMEIYFKSFEFKQLGQLYLYWTMI